MGIILIIKMMCFLQQRAWETTVIVLKWVAEEQNNVPQLHKRKASTLLKEKKECNYDLIKVCVKTHTPYACGLISNQLFIVMQQLLSGWSLEWTETSLGTRVEEAQQISSAVDFGLAAK